MGSARSHDTVLILKNQLYLYVMLTYSQNKVKKTIVFKIASKNITDIYNFYILPKEAKNLYSKNCKTLMKEVNDDKQMERYIMLLGWKNQYCQNDYTT